MNEVLNNIYTRRSIRKFKEQDVPKDLVDEIVKAGTYAPSGKNLQTYRFYVMQNADSIKSLQDVVAKGTENPAYTLYGAKAIVLVACEKEAVNGVERLLMRNREHASCSTLTWTWCMLDQPVKILWRQSRSC